MNKYNYLAVIQQNYANGFEDVSEYDKKDKDYKKNIKHDYKEYQLLGYPTRIINRRELVQ